MNLTFELDLSELECRISKSKVIEFKNYCPNTHTHTHTRGGPIAPLGSLKGSVNIEKKVSGDSSLDGRRSLLADLSAFSVPYAFPHFVVS